MLGQSLCLGLCATKVLAACPVFSEEKWGNVLVCSPSPFPLSWFLPVLVKNISQSWENVTKNLHTLVKASFVLGKFFHYLKTRQFDVSLQSGGRLLSLPTPSPPYFRLDEFIMNCDSIGKDTFHMV